MNSSPVLRQSLDRTAAIEQGKPTLQLQKTLKVLNLLGLEVVIRKRGGSHAV